MKKNDFKDNCISFFRKNKQRDKTLLLIFFSPQKTRTIENKRYTLKEDSMNFDNVLIKKNCITLRKKGRVFEVLSGLYLL